MAGTDSRTDDASVCIDADNTLQKLVRRQGRYLYRIMVMPRWRASNHGRCCNWQRWHV